MKVNDYDIKIDEPQFIDLKTLREWIKLRQRFDPYEWYKCDLRRKRPNRKRGRNLYHGILAYRRRVGQHEDRLSFRGIARMYDLLRIKAIRQHPELAAKFPNLYERFLYLIFPPHEIEAQLYDKLIIDPMKTLFYQGFEAMRTIKVPPLMVGELAMTLDGSDAVLARVKKVEQN